MIKTGSIESPFKVPHQPGQSGRWSSGSFLCQYFPLFFVLFLLFLTHYCKVHAASVHDMTRYVASKVWTVNNTQKLQQIFFRVSTQSNWSSLSSWAGSSLRFNEFLAAKMIPSMVNPTGPEITKLINPPLTTQAHCSRKSLESLDLCMDVFPETSRNLLTFVGTIPGSTPEHWIHWIHWIWGCGTVKELVKHMGQYPCYYHYDMCVHKNGWCI